MPERFSLPPIFKTFYKDLEAEKYQVSTSKLTTRERFTAWLNAYRTKLWFGFYTALFLVVVGTAYTLETTGIAHTIMENSRRRVSQQYAAWKATDHSTIRISATTGMVALVTDPNGKLIGDTAEGIRHLELENGTLTSQNQFNLQEIINHRSLKSWGLLINSPEDGGYNIEFSAKYPGTYHFTLTTTNKPGTSSQEFSDTIEIEKNQRHRYNLAFHKNQDDAIRLVFRNTFYRH